MIFLLAWVLLSFVNSFKEISIKYSLKTIDTQLLIWIMSFFSSLLMLPFVISEWIPNLTPKYFAAFWIWWILYFIWKYFYFKALEIWDISFIAPLKWFVILNVILTSWLLLWEVPSSIWFIWMILIVLWIYVLSIQKWHISFLDPIKHLITNKWSRLYLITSVAYWFTVTIDKIGVLETSPFFWAFSMTSFLFFVTLPKIIKDFWKTKKIIIKNYKILSWIVILQTCISVWQMYIISNILASYTSAFKASSALFSIVIWWIIFKEKDLQKRFLAWLIIVWGIILIVLS